MIKISVAIVGVMAFLALVTGCAGTKTIVHVRCPEPPILLKVEVRNGVIRGKDKDNAIENHQSIWQYVHLLRKLGCTAK